MIDLKKRYGFMPGCSLPSYNPVAVAKTTEWLASVFPKFAAVQKCCGKPTKAIGQYDLFKKRFKGLEDDIKAVEIEILLSACQNCYLIVKEYSDIVAQSLWEVVPQIGLPKEMVGKAKHSDVTFTIHDSCPTRHETGAHNGIRWILQELGYNVLESERSRENTRCCGFGGMIVPAKPGLAKRVMQRRLDTLKAANNIVVYCAACRSSLAKVGGRAWHILDLLWGPVINEKSEPPTDVLASPVKSWVNRYKAKAGMEKAIK